MLSPKKPKPHVEAAGELLPQDRYDCTVDTLAFRNALDHVVARLENNCILTSQSFDPHNLAVFLTRCVEVCHNALDG